VREVIFSVIPSETREPYSRENLGFLQQNNFAWRHGSAMEASSYCFESSGLINVIRCADHEHIISGSTN
jgi:hypothetical protein